MKPEDLAVFRKIPPEDQLGILLYLEARGEPVQGQIAVGCVVRNRVKAKKENTYFDIITAENQFSCLNSNDPNYDKGMMIVKSIVAGIMPEELTGMLQQCRFLAVGIVTRQLLDLTGKATNYYNPDEVKDKDGNKVTPEWAKDMMVTTKIGNHIFLKGK